MVVVVDEITDGLAVVIIFVVDNDIVIMVILSSTDDDVVEAVHFGQIRTRIPVSHGKGQ
jgi:hypothetical protein